MKNFFILNLIVFGHYTSGERSEEMHVYIGGKEIEKNDYDIKMKHVGA